MKSELANLLGKKLGDLTLKEFSEVLTLFKNLSPSLDELKKQPEQNIGSFISMPSKVVKIVEFVDTYSTADAIMKGRIKHKLAEYAMLKQRDLDYLNKHIRLRDPHLRPYCGGIAHKINPSYEIDLTRISEDIYSFTQLGEYTRVSQEIKKILDLAGIKTLP